MKNESVEKSLEKSKNVLEEKRKMVKKKICIKNKICIENRSNYVYNNCYDFRSRAINNKKTQFWINLAYQNLPAPS